jgi:hypothetical protein
LVHPFPDLAVIKLTVMPENSYWKQNDEDCIDFTVSQDVKLVGVCFFGSKSYDAEHYLKISIFRVKDDIKCVQF